MKMSCNSKCALFVNEYLNSGGECAFAAIGNSLREIDFTLQGEVSNTPISQIADCLDELSSCVKTNRYGGKEFYVNAEPEK